LNTEIYNSKNSKKLVIEKPRISDIPRIHQIINYFADNNEMLPRPLSDLYENIRECLVVKKDGVIIGCSFLHVYWSDLAEIRSLAVVETDQRRGIGSEVALMKQIDISQ